MLLIVLLVALVCGAVDPRHRRRILVRVGTVNATAANVSWSLEGRPSPSVTVYYGRHSASLDSVKSVTRVTVPGGGGGDSWLLLSGLEPHSTYRVQLIADRPTAKSRTRSFHTLPEGGSDPGVDGLELRSESPSSLSVSWRPSGSAAVFKVRWSPRSCPDSGLSICATYEHNVSQSQHIIQDLAAGVEYVVSVSRLISGSFSPACNASLRTLSLFPPVPEIAGVDRLSPTSVRVRVRPSSSSSSSSYPRVLHYVVRYTEGVVVDGGAGRRSVVSGWAGRAVVAGHRGGASVDVLLADLLDDRLYTVAASSATERSGEWVESDPSAFHWVDEARRPAARAFDASLRRPHGLEVVNGSVSSTSAQLAFRLGGGPALSHVEVAYEGFQSYTDSLGTPRRNRDAGVNNVTLLPPGDDRYVWILSALVPNTHYTVNVSSVGGGATSAPASAHFTTAVDVPPYIEIPYLLGADRAARTVRVGLRQTSSKNGPIRKYFVVVERFDLIEPFGISAAYSFRKPIDRPNLWTAAVFDAAAGGRLPSLFVLGTNSNGTERHRGETLVHVNRPLSAAGKYRVKLCVEVEGGQGGELVDCSSFSSVFGLSSAPRRRIAGAADSLNYSVLWLAAISVLVLVILAIFAVLVFQIRVYRTRRWGGKGVGAAAAAAAADDDPTDYQDAPLLVTQRSTIGDDDDPSSSSSSSNDTFASENRRREGGSNPIRVSAFLSELDRLKRNDQFALSQEYDAIDPGGGAAQFTWKHSLLDSNRAKNRYANVTAYDHSRVVLGCGGGPADYINANYIDGWRRPRAYIATQGPLAGTVGDFWRMVWQERAAGVVMLTRLEERNRKKCDAYWPQRRGQTECYGGGGGETQQVQMMDETRLAAFTVRHLKLTNAADTHSIVHLQFTGWPDHGVPLQCTTFLMFCQRVQQLIGDAEAPIIVHCSAGVGRTGCFVAVHNLSQKLALDPTPVVDVCAYTTQMRAQRNYMVQTDEQYAFVYECVAELVRYGAKMDQCVHAKLLPQHVQTLLAIDNGGGGGGGRATTPTITRMELEFKRLASCCAPPDKFLTAQLDTNRFKNRLVNILPFEWNRFVLCPPIVATNNTTGLSEASDYINASIIDSYERQGAFIAAQSPLPNTITEFWMMVWQSGCSIVVMLTKLMEMGKEKCAQYWPQEGFAEYPHLRIDTVAHYNMHAYTVSEFKLTHIPDGAIRTIRQFRYLKWPDQGVPEDAGLFLEFTSQVHKTREQFGLEHGPIVVHCNAGVAQTGIFITVSTCIERLRLEGLVDVFMAVRSLRSQRVAMVQTEDQYQFCYSAILQYINYL